MRGPMAMMQLLPVLVYYGAQQMCKAGGPLASVLPKDILDWAPVACAVLSFIVMSQVTQAQAAKAASKLVGQLAPPFDFTVGEKKTSIADFMKENARPTIIDFYQNF